MFRIQYPISRHTQLGDQCHRPLSSSPIWPQHQLPVPELLLQKLPLHQPLSQPPEHTNVEFETQSTSINFAIAQRTLFQTCLKVGCILGNSFWVQQLFSGYTYMAVWVGGLEVWDIRVMCKKDQKKLVLFLCFVLVFFV
jgi:hypothetical protein